MQATLSIALIVFQAIVLIALLWLLIVWLYRAVKWLAHGVIVSTTPNASHAVRLISLAFAGWLFPSVLFYVVAVLQSLFDGLFVQYTELLSRNFDMIANECVNDSDACLIKMGNAVWYSFAILAKTLVKSIQLGKLPIVDMMLLYAVWVVAANLISLNWIKPEGVGTLWTASRAAVSSWLGNHVARQNTLAVVILLIAVFLALSSIAAIESLKVENNKPELTAEKLDKSLASLKIEQAQFDSLYPLEFKGVDLTPPKTDEAQGGNVSVWQVYRLFDNNLKNHRLAWGELRQYYYEQQDKMQAQAVLAFEVGSNQRKGSREHAKHFLDIFEWYQSWISDYQTHLNDCRAQIKGYAAQANVVSGFLEPLINSTEMRAGLIQSMVDASTTLSNTSREVAFRCQPKDLSVATPTRADFGSFLGPMGLLFRWLLAAESQPMALIVGLFGMGLLGTASSSFIKHSLLGTEMAQGEPWIPNLMSVFARGISAAILMYVAVYGGLLVIAEGGAEPNAYIVLAICFVASVFSDKAWQWAKDKVLQPNGADAANNKPEVK